jgi:hypothetical protein
MRICLHLPLILGIVSVWFASQAVSGAERLLKSRTFQLTYQATIRDIPKDAKTLEAWVPLPQTDPNQTIHQISINAPVPVTIGRDARSGNQSLQVRVDRPKGPVQITLVIEATRRENAGHQDSLSAEDRRTYLAPEPLVPLDGPIRRLAVGATAGLTTEEAKARAIYETVTARMRYDKSGTGWGRGDALYACEAKRGNCTDFHALLIGVARSAGIPARFAIGLPLPAARGSGEIPCYHCWAELYVDGRGWIPVDSSEMYGEDELGLLRYCPDEWRRGDYSGRTRPSQQAWKKVDDLLIPILDDDNRTWEQAARPAFETMIQTLADLDDQGFFGRRAERESITLMIWITDSSLFLHRNAGLFNRWR